MSKDVELVGGDSGGDGKGKKKTQTKSTKANPMGSWGAQRLLEEDRLKNPAAVQATTQTLIEEGFLPSRQLLEVGFLDDDLYECLSRMEKKDSATKSKALLDFLQILPTKSIEKLLNTRTFWARHFVSCMEDDDPRIREAACRCQEAYVALLKKDTLPILPTVIGPWWLAQYQMHSSAAVAARNSFHSAFTPAKRPDVLRSCATPILALLQRRILPRAAPLEKAAKGKGTGAEMSEEQQQKVAEALEALAGFVRGVGDKGGLEEVEGRVVGLLETPELWKLAKMSSPKGRQAFFELQRALWERMEGVAAGFLKQNMTAIIGNLHERDQRAALATWSLWLLIMSKNDAWSSVIDLHKVILPKVLSLLKNAGFGTAASTFPFLVVFLEKVPQKNVEFLSGFMGALLQGAAADTVRTSEVLAICTATAECFGYIVRKMDAETAKTLVEQYLTPLIQDSLLGTSNVIKGVDVLLKMVLTWLKDKQGETRRFLAEEVLVALADKLRYASAEVVASPRTDKWIQSLFDAGKAVFPEHADDQRKRLTEPVETFESLQEVLYQLLRLSFLWLKDSPADQSQPLTRILRHLSSPVLYTRLQTFIETTPTPSSPQLILFRALPPPHDPQLLCLLLQDCRNETDAQEMFTAVWNAASDKLHLLHLFEQYGGIFLIERYGTEEQMEDLIRLAEDLVRSREIGNLPKLLALMGRLQGNVPEIQRRLMGQVVALDADVQLRVLHVLLAEMSGRGDVQGIMYQIVVTALQLQELDEESGEILRNMARLLAKHRVTLSDEKLYGQLRSALKTTHSVEITTQVLVTLLEPLSHDAATAKEIVTLCGEFTDFARLSEGVVERKDVFLVRINRIAVPDDLQLVNGYWNEQLEVTARMCLLSASILMDLNLTADKSAFSSLLRCAADLYAYLDLAFGSGAPVVFDRELFVSLQVYHTKLRKFLDVCGYLTEVVSFAPVEGLSEEELVNVYAQLWKMEALPEEQVLYRNSVRDRLETVLAFAEIPRTCAAIQSAPWKQIQLWRIIPSLLSERCLDLEYSGPALDVFGTVVIDWITCLQEDALLPLSPKVVVLVLEAMEGVANILTAKQFLSDTGMLWLELTEFSFPRILAGLLAGLLTLAAADEMYLKERPVLGARMLAVMCGLLHEFAVQSQGLLKPVWETLFRLEEGLPDRLSVLRSPPSQMTSVLIRLFSPLLIHKVAHVQLTACTLLTHLLPAFPPAPSLPAAPLDATPDQLPTVPPPIELLSVLEESADIVETMLQDVPLGTSFGAVVPDTDSYTYMLVYLLAWRGVLAWYGKEASDTRQAVARYLDANGSFTTLLDNLVALLPLDGEQGRGERRGVEDEGYVMQFVPALSDLEEMSSVVYREALRALPMLARGWYSRKQGAAVWRSVGRYTASVVSPGLVREELQGALQQAREIVLDNFKVHVRPTVAEITAEYRVESWLAEIVVRIPKDYPLTGVHVSWGTTKGSCMDAWDSWVIRLSGFLRRQNGSLLEGILDWKRSVDGKFAGVENCAICLSVVDIKTGQLPTMQCKTCRNKFHNECLFRWFQQQVDPTCPLCREKFFT